MSATPGSTYQALAAQHLAGNPPNADPQRLNENYTEYINRMAAQGCKPDIGATESDDAYIARLAGYSNVVPTTYVQKAWGQFYNASASFVTNTWNCSITRSAVGTYPITFASNVVINNPNYVISYQGYSGSAVTASTELIISQSATGFTMITSNINAPLTLTDPVTASFKVDSL